MKVIIQGFGSRTFLFEDFIKNFGNILVLENNTNTYKEVESQLLKLYNGNKFDIFGWSLGSLYALNFTLNNKDLVNSLFLTGATARFIERDDYNNGIKRETVERMLILIKRRKEIVMRDFYNNIFKFVNNKERIIDRLLKELPEESILENGLKALIEYDILDRLEEINVPVFICQGIHDTITPKENAIFINKKISNSILKLVEGGHSYFLENEEECGDLWKDFFTKVQ